MLLSSEKSSLSDFSNHRPCVMGQVYVYYLNANVLAICNCMVTMTLLIKQVGTWILFIALMKRGVYTQVFNAKNER